MMDSYVVRPKAASSMSSYLAAAVLVGVAVGAALVFRRLPHANLPLLFLMAVLIIAARWGLWPSIFASLLSFLALNFLFTPPLYTFTVEEEGDFATLILFLAMAGLTGNLAARMRVEMANSQAALERVSALLDFSRRMAGAASAQEALKALVDRLFGMFRVRTLALLPNARGRLEIQAERESNGENARFDLEDANKAWAAALLQRPTGMAGWTRLPLVTAGGPVGLIAVAVGDTGDERRELADGLCDQASIAVERTLLVDSLREARLVSETERLRSALLSSVSHDLRTPLASIIGSTTSMLEYSEVLKPEDRQELLQTVLAEAERLNRYVQNLLDMTRFGQQPFELRREWVDLNDLVSAAIERLGAALADVELRVEVASAVSLIKVHGALIEQMLVNLLDNAAGFAPKNSAVDIKAYKEVAALIVEVIDRGPGIPEDEREKVFDMFYRVQQGDRRRPGTGLGLAICQSVVRAHGGSVQVRPGPRSIGTTVRISLPLAENPTDEEQHDQADPDRRRRRTNTEVSAH